MSNKISMAFDTFHTRKILRRDGWKVKPKTFLQKLAWRFLNKRGAVKPYREEIEVCKVVNIDGDDILKNLMEAKYRLFEIGREPSAVFIGRQDLMETMRDDRYGHITTYVTAAGCIGYCHQEYKIPLTVIPHMRGVLVI